MIKSFGVKLFSFHHAGCWLHFLDGNPNLSNDSYTWSIDVTDASVESVPFTSSSANFNKFFWLDAIWKYHMVSTVKCKDNRDLKSRFIWLIIGHVGIRSNRISSSWWSSARNRRIITPHCPAGIYQNFTRAQRTKTPGWRF